MLLKGMIKPIPGEDKDGKKIKAFPVRLISAWGWGPSQVPQWWFWERMRWGCACSWGWFSSSCCECWICGDPTNFFFSCSLQQGWREGEGGCWHSQLSPWPRGSHVHSHQAQPKDIAGTTTTTCLLSFLQQTRLVQKPGFPQAGALARLHGLELGDKEQSAEVPLMGQSGARRHSRAPHPPANKPRAELCPSVRAWGASHRHHDQQLEIWI